MAPAYGCIVNCSRWLELIAAYKGGEATQRSADQQKAVQETKDELAARAKTDDQVRRTPNADVTEQLSKWERPSSGSQP